MKPHKKKLYTSIHVKLGCASTKQLQAYKHINLCNLHGKNILICGKFNVKSSQWVKWRTLRI